MADNKPDPFTGLDKMLLNPKRQQPPVAIASPQPQPEPEPEKAAPKKERQQAPSPAVKKDRYHDSNLSSDQDSIIAAIRKSVRARGTEQSIHRLSPQEKREIKDIVYTYDTQGVRTSEVELTRIALNFLIADHKEHGKDSVLARALSSLKD